MKKNKLILFIGLFIISAISFTTDFTFNDYRPNTKSEFLITEKKVSTKFNLPVISGDDGAVVRKINKTLENFQKTYSKLSNTVTYTVEADNSSVISILFKVENEDGINYYPLVFDNKTGNQLQLSDLFLAGYEDSLSGAIKERIGFLGLPLNDKFKVVNSKTKFILTNDSVEIVFNTDEITSFGDKIAFVPFKLVELVGILK